MKRTVIITEISLILLLMSFALSGCGSRREKEDEPAGQTAVEPAGQNIDDAPASSEADDVLLSLDVLQGHWVDVNGDTTLDFAGDQMTVYWGGYEDLYTVGVTGTDRYGTVFNAEDRNRMFEMMSELTWRSGILTAGEMVLDAEGHSFRFVREEALEGELAIVDDSRNMPKEITSEDLARFHLTFSLEDTRFDVPDDADWYSARYSIDVERGDAALECPFSIYRFLEYVEKETFETAKSAENSIHGQ